MIMRRFVFLMILSLCKVGFGQRIWEGECGASTMTPRGLISQHPWHILLKGQQAGNRNSMKNYGSATLIRANGKAGESDIAISSYTACQQFCNKGEALFGMDDGTKVLRVPVAECIPAGKLDTDICVVVLKQAVNFSPTVKPACVEEPKQTVAKGSYGYVLAWDSLMRQMVEVSRKVIDQQNAQTFVIEASQDPRSSPVAGGPFFTRNNVKYVLQAVNSRPSTNANNPSFLYNRLAPFILNGWLETTIKEKSSLWKNAQSG